MKNDTSYLKENTAGTTLMKKESNIMLASNLKENGYEKVPESLRPSLMKDKLLFKKK